MSPVIGEEIKEEQAVPSVSDFLCWPISWCKEGLAKVVIPQAWITMCSLGSGDHFYLVVWNIHVHILLNFFLPNSLSDYWKKKNCSITQEKSTSFRKMSVHSICKCMYRLHLKSFMERIKVSRETSAKNE